MNTSERQEAFAEAVKKSPHFKAGWTVKKGQSATNSARILDDGIMVGVINLENAPGSGFAACSYLMLPGDVIVYIALLVGAGVADVASRLKEMIQLHEAGKDFGSKNNNVRIYLRRDGAMFLTSSKYLSTIGDDSDALGSPIPVEGMLYAVFPPSSSTRQSLLAGEMIGQLGAILGAARLHQLHPFGQDSGEVTDSMKRDPRTMQVQEIESAVAKLGGYYPGRQVRRFHAALNHLETKHFVILSGLSGTGKTSLATRYAQAVHGITDPKAPDPLFFRIPVRPDWTDPTGLLGYFDAIAQRYVAPTFLRAVLAAIAFPAAPVFVLLDEMNNARIEYYLADILSAMEMEEGQATIDLHGSTTPYEGTNDLPIPKSVPLPRNFYIIGSINIDETVQAISDKVLDRAVVVDMSEVDIAGFLQALKVREPALGSSISECGPLLAQLSDTLGPQSNGFGYRVASEFVRYHHYETAHLGSKSDEVVDDQLVQKVLVKLRGTEQHGGMLQKTATIVAKYPRAAKVIGRLQEELTEFGSFQNTR